MPSTKSEIPEYIRELYEELSRELQNTYLKWKIYRQVFGSGIDRIEFLDYYAPSFFLAVRDAFSSDVVVSITRFTDKSKGSLTLNSIIKQLEKSSAADLAGKLKEYQKQIDMEAQPIKKWRDNLIAHKSLKTVGVRPEEPLPNVTWAHIDSVLEKIAAALNSIEGHFCDSEVGYAWIITRGDGDEVIRLMELAVKTESDELRKLGRDL